MQQQHSIGSTSHLRSTWERAYSLGHANSLWGDRQNPFVTEAIEQYLESGATTVLDLGCGDGRNTIALAKRIATVVGVDISATALELCERRLRHAHALNCLLMQGDATNLPFADEQFGGSLCANLLGQIPAYQPVLGELLRVTRRGGVVVVNVLSTEDETQWGERFVSHPDGGLVYDGSYYYRFFDEAAVMDLVSQAAGAELISVRTSRWLDDPHPGYRPEPHEHQSWVITLKRSVRQ